MNRIKIVLYILTSFFPFIGASQTKSNFVIIDAQDSQQEIIAKAAHVVPSESQFRWQQLELTAFFHFGINTFTDKEWGDGTENPQLFNPTNLDVEQWIQAVKAAGFKQVILTAKHHDGFCLWPTQTTKHSVVSSPWENGKGDVVRLVADACRKYDIGFGIYLSPWDRNASCYGTDAYNDFFITQLTELLTQYGTIDEVWFDGANGEGPNGKKQEYDFMRWYAEIRKLQPQAVIAIMGPDVRWVGTETGMGRFTEWSVVPTDNMDLGTIASSSQNNVIFKPKGDLMGEVLGSREQIYNAKSLVWYPAETDVSIRPGWFYHAGEDSKVKTPEQLMEIYFTSVGMNSVLLLNIPPNKEGLISDADLQSLEGFAALRNNTFKQNIARQAHISCSNGGPVSALTDNVYDTFFTTDSQDTTCTIKFQFEQEVSINVLSIQENIKIGQRIESFELQYLTDKGAWVTATTGTTVGYKRLLRFPNIKTKMGRLVIHSSRLNPTISEIGFYFIDL